MSPEPTTSTGNRRTALVTGATGYIGGRLVRDLLAAGFAVRCLARDPGKLRDQPWFADVEVVRGDAEIRMERLNEPLAGANSVDDILEVLVANLNDLIENDPGFFCGLFELFSAGRQNTEIREGVGALYSVTTDHVAGILAAKDAEGVLSLRFGARAVTASLFAMADGFALQVISNPDSDHSAALESLAAAAKHLLDA